MTAPARVLDDRPSAEQALVPAGASDRSLTEALLGHLTGDHNWRPWWILFAIASAGVVLLVVTVTYTVATGIGVWGNNIPVAWAFAITNFVWWIGIGHAGTFISAFLIL